MLLKRQQLCRQIGSRKGEGGFGELLREVNSIYKSEVVEGSHQGKGRGQFAYSIVGWAIEESGSTVATLPTGNGQVQKRSRPYHVSTGAL